MVTWSPSRPSELITEYEDIIVSTDSMSLADWRKMAVFSWVTMLLHSMKLGFFVLYYLHDRYGVVYSELISHIAAQLMNSGTGQVLREEVAEFETQLDRILEGHGRGRELPEFGGIYWDEEEASFLRVSEKLGPFYDELLAVLQDFLKERGISWDDGELSEVVQYQRMRIPACDPPSVTQWRFNSNFPEYSDTCYLADSKPLTAKPQVLTLTNPKDYEGNKSEYARETILWGRKSGTMLTEVIFHDE